jgi:DNA-binding GntR family transcriptional regulator
MNEEGRTTPLVDQIVATLEQAIAAGEFAPGERLSELSLAATLGVSRAPLREAFRKLEGRRIVERNAAGSVRVQSLTLEDLEQLLNVRETLEGMASRCAALCMSAEDIADLRACAMQKKLELEGLGSVFQNNSQDHDFHVKIARGSGNRWPATILCEDLYGLLRIYRYSAGTMGLRAEAAYREHSDIIDAIEKHDPDAAEATMRTHNRNGRVNLLDTLRRAQSGQKVTVLRPLGTHR